MRKKSILEFPVDVMEFIFVLAIVLLKVFFIQPCLDCGGSKDILDLRICGQQSVCGLSYEPASDCSAGI